MVTPTAPTATRRRHRRRATPTAPTATDADGTDGDGRRRRHRRRRDRRHRRRRHRHHRRGRVRLSALDLLSGDAQTFIDEGLGVPGPPAPHRPGASWSALLSLDDVDHLLTSTAIRTPSVRLAQDGTVLPESSYTRGATLAGKPLTGLVDARKALALFDDGATVVLQGLHRYWPPLTALVAELELELGHPCQANAYLTPPGSQGFAVHSDTHDVFVFQTAGLQAVGGAHRRRRRGRAARARPRRCTCRPAPRTPPARRTRSRCTSPSASTSSPGAACVERAVRAGARRACPTTTCPRATSTTRRRSPTARRPARRRSPTTYAGVDADGRGRRRGTPVPHQPQPPRLPGGLKDVLAVARPRPTTPCCAGGPATRACCSTAATGSRCCSATARSTYPAWLRPALEQIRARDRARARPTCRSTRRAGWCCAAGWSGRACSRSSGDLTAASAVRRRERAARRAAGRHRVDRPARSCCSSTPGRGATTPCATPGCPTVSAAARRARAAAAGVRVLLIRRPGRRRTAARHPRLRGVRRPAAPWLERGALADLHDVLDLDLAALRAGRSAGPGTRDPGTLFCVCTHGRHDACCAERGRPVAAALAAAHPEETWEVSHIGGDRFAGNLLVLPHGLYYGRLDAPTAVAVGAATTRPASSTSTTCAAARASPMPVQAAEIALRRELGETRNDAVRLTAAAATAQAPKRFRGGRCDAGGCVCTHHGRRADPAHLPGHAREPDPGRTTSCRSRRVEGSAARRVGHRHDRTHRDCS